MLYNTLSGLRVLEVRQTHHRDIFFTPVKKTDGSPGLRAQGWFKLFNAAKSVGQPVSFVTAGVCSAPLSWPLSDGVES